MDKNIFNVKKTYLSVIQNSVGIKIFQHLYIKDKKKNKSVDVVQGGRLSCAFFASNILYIFGLINEPHATVNATTKDMLDFGWYKIKKPKKGAVIIWTERKYGSGKKHKHLGFYVGNKFAISNSYKKGLPLKHHFTYGEKDSPSYCKIENIFWHSKLD